MATDRNVTKSLIVEWAGSCDSAGPVVMVKAIDLAMCQYFGLKDWLTVRNKLFPGLRRKR